MTEKVSLVFTVSRLRYLDKIINKQVLNVSCGNKHQVHGRIKSKWGSELKSSAEEISEFSSKDDRFSEIKMAFTFMRRPLKRGEAQFPSLNQPLAWPFDFLFRVVNTREKSGFNSKLAVIKTFKEKHKAVKIQKDIAMERD